MTTASANVIIRNELGLHAKPAMAFGHLASKFESAITVTRIDNGETVDAASLMSMLTLALTEGTEIRIEATGADAQQAVDQLMKLVERKFGEA